jgi:hypothetical protein
VQKINKNLHILNGTYLSVHAEILNSEKKSSILNTENSTHKLTIEEKKVYLSAETNKKDYLIINNSSNKKDTFYTSDILNFTFFKGIMISKVAI